nr:TerD family protein [Bacillus changyiensis]
MGIQSSSKSKSGIQLGGSHPNSNQPQQQSNQNQQQWQQPAQNQQIPNQSQQAWQQPAQNQQIPNQSQQYGQAMSSPQGNQSFANSITLVKGQKFDLTKGNPSLDQIQIGLGWDLRFDGVSYDLDAELFLLDQTGRVQSPHHFIFYNNPLSPDGAVQHSGDNTSGQGEGDDESITVQLSKISPDIQRIAITVTIHDANSKRQNFGQVANAYIRVINRQNNTEICKFNLTDDYSTSISIIFAELYRHNGEWKFNALGEGSSLDLSGICNRFGLSL